MKRRTFLALSGGMIVTACQTSQSYAPPPRYVPENAASITRVRAENDTEQTEFRYRGQGWWDEISRFDGAVRYSFEEVNRDRTVIYLVDRTRNGGLALRINLARRVVELSEGAGQPFYDRYRITAAA